MARFGRSVPPSTRLWRSTARYEGAEPRYLTVGVAGSEERARPVNRAIGEVRTAGELDTAPAAGRGRARTVGVPTEAGTALALAGRKHRRDVAIAGETSSVPGITRKHRRDVGLTTDYETALPAFDEAVVSDAVFAAAIESTDRQPTFTLRADWGRDGQFGHALSDLSPLVEQVTVERELQGDLPPEVGQIEGFAAASLKATLSGRWPDEDLSPAEVFAPYRTDSPLYGEPLMQTPVQLDTGFVTPDGVREDRRFTGTVRRLSPRSGGRTVALDAMDATFRLRQPITLPGVALFRDLMEQQGPDKYRHRINTQWLIDYILRRNGIYASPPARSDAILSVTGHGSAIPEVGWGGAPDIYYQTYRGPTSFTGGPFGMMYEVDNWGQWWTQSTVTANAGTGVGLSMWAAMSPADGIQRECFRLSITTNATWWIVFGHGADGRPYIGLDGPGANDLISVSPTGWTPVTSTRFMFIGAHIAFAATSMTVSWRIGGQLYTNTVTIPTRANNIWSPAAYVDYNWSGRPYTNLQMWQSASPPAAGLWQGESWTPQADLDPGGNNLTGLPEMVAADGWDLIKEICAAEASRFQFTESGRPQFRTRIGDAARGTPAVSETITASKNLADLVANTDEASIRNVINLKTTQLLVSDWQDYYKAPAIDTFDTPPGTHSFDVELPTAAYEIPPPRSTFGGRSVWTWYDYGGNGFMYAETNDEYREQQDNPNAKHLIRTMVVRADDGQVVVVNGVQIRVIRLSPWQMRIIVNNEQNYTVRFATQSTVDSQNFINPGEPALTIPARIVESGQEQLETFTDPDSIALYGTSSFDIGGSGTRWRQTPDALGDLAAKVLETTAHPVPVLDAVDVPHDPRRRIGQRITLADPDGLGTVTATIVGLSTTYSSSGATDRITVRPIAAPGQ